MRSTEIFVTNHNDFHHSDQYAGVPYEFPPKERVAVSVDAAVHMFGFNLPDKNNVLNRLGWAWHYDAKAHNFVENPEGAKQLARFVFTKAVMVEAPIDAPDPEQVGLANAGADEALLPPPPRKTKAIDFLSVENAGAPLV